MPIKFGSLNIVDKVVLPEPLEWPEVTDVPVVYDQPNNTKLGQLVHANGEISSVKIQSGVKESNGAISVKQ